MKVNCSATKDSSSPGCYLLDICHCDGSLFGLYAIQLDMLSRQHEIVTFRYNVWAPLSRHSSVIARRRNLANSTYPLIPFAINPQLSNQPSPPPHAHRQQASRKPSPFSRPKTNSTTCWRCSVRESSLFSKVNREVKERRMVQGRRMSCLWMGLLVRIAFHGCLGSAAILCTMSDPLVFHPFPVYPIFSTALHFILHFSSGRRRWTLLPRSSPNRNRDDHLRHARNQDWLRARCGEPVLLDATGRSGGCLAGGDGRVFVWTCCLVSTVCYHPFIV